MGYVLLVEEDGECRRIFDASTPEKLRAACLKLLKQLVAESALNVGEEPPAPVQVPEGLPQWLHKEAERVEQRMQHYHAEWCKRGALLRSVECALSEGSYDSDETRLVLLQEAASGRWWVSVMDVEGA